MSLSQTARKLAETAIFRRLYGERHTAKRLAADSGVSPATAKSWLNAGAPRGRRDRLLAQLRAQLDRRVEELAEAEAELAQLETLWRARR